MHGIEFNEPFASIRGLQTVKITAAITSSARMFSTERLEEMQLQAQFLQCALRLNPFDIGLVLSADLSWKNTTGGARKHYSMFQWIHEADMRTEVDELISKISERQQISEQARVESMLKVALPTLRFPIDLNCLNTIGPAMRGCEALSTLRSELFVAINVLAGNYGVLFHFKGDAAQGLTRQLTPSYFMKWPAGMDALPQVHIPNGRIASMSNCHIVSFASKPSTKQIEHIKMTLGTFLNANGCRALHSEPFLHRVSSPIFNVDGCISRQVHDRVLCPIAKSALSLQVEGRAQREVAIGFADKPREPVTIVIWARQSPDMGTVSTTISRQVWTALTSHAPPLMSLQVDDRIVVVVEYCSSSKHPQTDRQLFKVIPTDRPLRIITSNPDRLTRRSQEVPMLLENLAEDVEWWSQGVTFNEMSQSAWFRVSDAVAEVQEHIEIGETQFL